MAWRIGEVTIEDEFYPGRDLYSDGDVEEELLEIAMSTEEGGIDSVIAERKSWPVMYHFSPVRENILEWYPVNESDKVLEIGAGCGAVTGALAKRAGSVTCVDLSKRRSLVNAWRHRDFGNITIKLGNFEDVEKVLDRDYTLITLIGVFEYACGYVDGPTPYVDFLKKISEHLAPGGSLLIAIENRLGLKYFAGCREDHSGILFDGIEEYPGGGSARTFSKNELEQLIKEAGFTSYSFRYPYPDYKFPMSIFSDERLPRRGELKGDPVNFDRDRLLVFDEGRAFDALCGSGDFQTFSNSFFVEISKGTDGRKAAPYIKYSDDRAPRFRIRTDVFPGERAVKRAISESSASHIRNMAAASDKLSAVYAGSGLSVICGDEDGAAVSYPFVEGESLEGCADSVINDPPAVSALFKQLFDEIDRVSAEEFEITDDFRQVFGECDVRSARTAAVTNVDLLADNIIMRDGAWTVLDAEWTFDFPVPSSFVKWRTIHYYTARKGGGAPEIRRLLLDAAGITPEDEKGFAAMEASFQSWISGGVKTMWQLYGEMGQPVRPIEGASNGASGSAVVYFDRGSGYSESDRINLRRGEDGSYSATIEAGGMRSIRIDPSDGPSTMKLVRLDITGADGGLSVLPALGYSVAEGEYVFPGDDPQLIIRPADGEDGQERGTFADAAVLNAVFEADESPSAVRDAVSRAMERMALDTAELRDREASLAATVENMKRAAAAIRDNRAVRAYLAGRRKLGLDDPFDSLRPALKNGSDVHMTLDRRAYEPDGIHLLGWFLDPQCSGEIIRITDASGQPLDVEISRSAREDVSAALGLPAGRKTGWHIVIPYEKAGDQSLYIEAEDQRGMVRLMLDTGSFSIPDDAGCDALRPSVKEYNDIVKEKRAELFGAASAEGISEADLPHLSFAVPLYRTEPRLLRELIDSILSQDYPKIDIAFADGSESGDLGQFIRDTYPGEDRINYKHLEKNLGISGNTNAAVEMCRGDYIVFADHDDVVAEGAALEIGRAALSNGMPEMIYSDEDKVSWDGRFYFGPHFKPDFDPDLLTDSNYICHILAVRRDAALKAGPFEARFDGAQDYDFVLRVSQNAEKIVHIPKVLYHWRALPTSTAGRPESKNYAFVSGMEALNAHFERIGARAKAEMKEQAGHYRVSWEVEGEPKVSVIIPNRDAPEMLEKCVSSIVSKTTWKNYEIIIVENGSVLEETFSLYEKLGMSYGNIRVIRWDMGFNYAAINNFAAREAQGEYLLFLNNDTRVLSEGWMTHMLGLCRRADTGCVGALLKYPDGKIQHAGIIIGLNGGAAGHIYAGLDPNDFPGGGRALALQDYSAVTGACMMTKASCFEETGGFDESLAVAYNDVDYCLKLRERGLLVVYDPYAVLMHYESASRGADTMEADPEKYRRLMAEEKIFRERWAEYYTSGDPYYNDGLDMMAGL